jgi:hypothetical protein
MKSPAHVSFQLTDNRSHTVVVTSFMWNQWMVMVLQTGFKCMHSQHTKHTITHTHEHVPNYKHIIYYQDGVDRLIPINFPHNSTTQY